LAYAEQALIGSNAFALAYGANSVTDPGSEFGSAATSPLQCPTAS
jgi:hypothetical protein